MIRIQPFSSVVRRSSSVTRTLPLSLIALLVVLLTFPRACAPTPPPAIPAPAPASSASFTAPNKLGIHLLLDDALHAWPADIWPVHLRYARQVAGEWGYVTQLVRLDNLEVAQWQGFMDLCAALHLQPVLRLATTYDRVAGRWTAPPLDPDGTYRPAAARYADFATALTWPTSEHYLIVGNEPNHGNEWGGRPDPAAYARFLIDVAEALHARDPQARVLNAGFDPYAPHTGGQPFINGQIYMDEETFLDEMVAAYPAVFSHLDLWASHAYPLGPLTAPPWEQTFQIDLLNGAGNPHHLEPPPGLYNRGVNGYEWELFKLASYGLDPLPVMITETGWRHAESTDPAAPDNGRPLPEAETAALYLDLAWRGNEGRYPDLPEAGWTPWGDDPRVIAVTPFALNGLPTLWGHTNWLALDETGAVLSTYPLLAVQEALAGD